MGRYRQCSQTGDAAAPGSSSTCHCGVEAGKRVYLKRVYYKKTGQWWIPETGATAGSNVELAFRLGETIGPHHRYSAAPARHIQEYFNTGG